jgi:O-antigen ligase
MSVWSSQPGMLLTRGTLSIRRLEPRVALWVACLICVLVAEGAAITHSYLWAAPLVALLVVAVATDIPLTPFVTLILLVRVLTDASLSSASIRHTGSLNLSAGIAFLFILIGFGLLLRRRQGLQTFIVVGLFLCFWTAVAVSTHGASTETVREGVRELSILALAAIVCNSRGVLSVSVVVRLIQVVGIGSALLALYQLATHTGVDLSGQIRSNGTFTQPDGAAMYFAIATTASLWRYFDNGRRRLDALFAAVYAAATISTFSLTAIAGLLTMLVAFGALRPGSFRLKVGSFAVAGLIVIVFLATPVGAERIANESSTKITTARAGTANNTSLAWRLHKWETLIPDWERSPLLGQGLGTTVSEEAKAENDTAGKVPHNEYVRYLVETGVIGLTIVLWAVVLLIRALARKRGAFGTPDVGVLGIAIVAGCLVNALADNTLLYTTTGYAAALIVAAVLSSPNSTTAPQQIVDAS